MGFIDVQTVDPDQGGTSVMSDQNLHHSLLGQK
jgi:hypothetical protein